MVVSCYKALYQQLPRKAKKSHSNLGHDSRFLGRIFIRDLSHKQWGHKPHYSGAHPKILALSQLHCSLVSSVDSHYATGVRTTGLFEMIVGVLTTATSFARCNPLWFLSMGLRQVSGLCSSSSCKYPGTEGPNQNRHWNYHSRHATNSLERTRLSCWCLQNHKGCIYRAPVRYVTKTWSVVLLNKKYIYSYLNRIVYDKLLKPRQSFRITLYFLSMDVAQSKRCAPP